MLHNGVGENTHGHLIGRYPQNILGFCVDLWEMWDPVYIAYSQQRPCSCCRTPLTSPPLLVYTQTNIAGIMSAHCLTSGIRGVGCNNGVCVLSHHYSSPFYTDMDLTLWLPPLHLNDMNSVFEPFIQNGIEIPPIHVLHQSQVCLACMSIVMFHPFASIN